MTKSATDVMQDLVYAAVLDAVEALKKASKGVPNTLLRDLNALHVNTAFADTPADFQTAVQASVRSALTRLQREGYAIGPIGMQRPAMPPRTERPTDRPRGPRPGGPRPSSPDRRPGGGKGKPSGAPPKR